MTTNPFLQLLQFDRPVGEHVHPASMDDVCYFTDAVRVEGVPVLPRPRSFAEANPVWWLTREALAVRQKVRRAAAPIVPHGDWVMLGTHLDIPEPAATADCCPVTGWLAGVNNKGDGGRLIPTFAFDTFAALGSDVVARRAVLVNILETWGYGTAPSKSATAIERIAAFVNGIAWPKEVPSGSSPIGNLICTFQTSVELARAFRSWDDNEHSLKADGKLQGLCAEAIAAEYIESIISVRGQIRTITSSPMSPINHGDTIELRWHREAFPDGTYFVELFNMTTGKIAMLVIATVAA